MAIPAEVRMALFSHSLRTPSPPEQTRKPATWPLSSSLTTAMPELYGSPAIMKKFHWALLLENALVLSSGDPGVAPWENTCIGVVAVGLVLLANTTPLPMKTSELASSTPALQAEIARLAELPLLHHR